MAGDDEVGSLHERQLQSFVMPFIVVELVLLVFNPVGCNSGTVAKPEVKKITINQAEILYQQIEAFLDLRRDGIVINGKLRKTH